MSIFAIASYVHRHTQTIKSYCTLCGTRKTMLRIYDHIHLKSAHTISVEVCICICAVNLVLFLHLFADKMAHARTRSSTFEAFFDGGDICFVYITYHVYGFSSFCAQTFTHKGNM